MASLREKQEIQTKIDNMKLFAENLGAAIDLQHGLIAELEAKGYNIDYKDSTGKKENARELSKLRRELERQEKEYRGRNHEIEQLEEQLTEDDREDKRDDRMENETQRAIDAMIKLLGDSRIRQLTKDVLKDTLQAITEADFVTKIQLIGDKVIS